MRITDRFSFANAAYARAVANTPLFLLRKLQEDPTVRAIADSCTGDELLVAFSESVQQKPNSPEETVLPYVLLVALYFNTQAAYLRKAALVRPNYEDEWLAYILNVLLETYQPATRQIVELKANPTTSITTSATATSHHIVVPKSVAEVE
jgi:hypothetical protein